MCTAAGRKQTPQPMWHTYHRVSSLPQALNILTQKRERARIVAGATDLLIELERGVRSGVEALVDLSGIPSLNAIHLDEAGWIHLGPLTTHNACAASELIQTHALPLAQACWGVGAPQIRNRATVAGNLITASPANDTITPLMALGAVVKLTSERSERRVPLNEFYTGVRRTVLAPDEILTDIAFPALPAHARGLFIKLALRRAQAIAVVNVAVIVERNTQSAITQARITLGAVAHTIIHTEEAEQFLVGQTLTDEVIAQAGALAQKAARPIADVRAPAEYRSEMVNVMVKRALRAIAAGQERGALPEKPVLLESGTWKVAGSEQFTIDSEHAAITANINGADYTREGGQDKTLLRFLREDCGLTGTKEGCAEGECGACTVFLNGTAVMSCLVPAPAAHGAHITTIEGLSQGQPNNIHPVQQAFIDEAAVQCGYCTPGFIMAGAKLLEERPHASKHEIEQAFTGNLCRCTGYYKILAAMEKAAY